MINILYRIRTSKSKVIRFGAPLFALLVIVLISVLLIYSKTVPIPSSLVFQKKQSTPTVELKTAYSNPFDKETQYVNPFEKYKNPFVVNR